MIWDADELEWVYEPITNEEFAEFIGADEPDEYAYALEASLAYVQDVLNRNCLPLRPLPTPLYRHVVLEVAQEWTRRKDHGTVQMAGYENQLPVRLPRDPLTFTFPILRKYIGGGFA